MTLLWICAHAGGRENYAIERALSRCGDLQCMLTDAWVHPSSLLGFIQRYLNKGEDRFHPELAGASVRVWTASRVAFELTARMRKLSGWPRFLAENQWFQSRVARYLINLPPSFESGGQHVLFSYSYVALTPFRIAKQRGWRTVLDQLDPGLLEEKIIAELCRRYPQYAGAWQPAPAEYWSAWYEECSLADVIMVNSEWSRESLLTEGIPEEKIVVVPLAYELPAWLGSFERRYPEVFSYQRPLRVLFLGQVIIRKGIHDLVSTAESMHGEPVVFDVVGTHGPLPGSLPGNIIFHGHVSRNEALRWFRQADLFVLPTHSDGFALTQLEAMAHGLPVIATPRCGSVVEPGRTGWIVEPGNPEQLAKVIREALSDPITLAEMSAAAVRRIEDFSIERLSGCLSKVEQLLANALPPSNTLCTCSNQAIEE